MRGLTSGAGVVLLALSATAGAQVDCPRRWKEWEPQRTGIFFDADQPDQPVQTIHVSAEVATTLVFPSEVDPLGTRLVGGDGRFEPLMIAGRVVVIIPLHSLAAGESFSLVVALKGGLHIPLALRRPGLRDTSDGQVDIYLNKDRAPAVRRALELSQSRVEALTAENGRHVQEEASVDHALAALLAQDRVDLTPFKLAVAKLRQDPDVDVKIVTFLPKKGADPGKGAVVFRIANKDPRTSWELDEVRLISSLTGDLKPFAMRASTQSIGPGQSGVVAVVVDMKMFGPPERSDHLVLELWRSGPARQASVELVALDANSIRITPR
jgi:hypothetical protein